MIYSLLDACEYILRDQGEPQSSFWLASQIMEMKLWRATETGVRQALSRDINKHGPSSLFIRVAEDEFALRSWTEEKGLAEFLREPPPPRPKPQRQSASSATLPPRLEQAFPAVVEWLHGGGRVEISCPAASGVTVRAFGRNGLSFHGDRYETLDEAMAALDRGLRD